VVSGVEVITSQDWSSDMSKMGGDSARFNKIKTKRIVKRAKMRVLRAEFAAGKVLPGAEVERLKA
jgi:hypothetical protein